MLINGASGGVGPFAVQIAKAFGAEVTAVCSPKNVEMVREIGADHVIDYTREDFTKGTERYDVIMDNVGSHSLSATRSMLTPNGLHVPSSGHAGMGWVISAALAGMFVRQQAVPFVAVANTETLLALNELVEAGKVTPVIDRVLPLAQTADAFAYLDEGHARGKVVIAVSGSKKYLTPCLDLFTVMMSKKPDIKEVKMSFEEKTTWVAALVTLIVTVWYTSVVRGLMVGVPVAEIAYQKPLLIAVGATIVMTIVGAIVTAIGTAIGSAVTAEITGERSAEDAVGDIGRTDERDKDINRRGELIGYYVSSAGVVGVLVLAMLRYDQFWIANALYLSFALGTFVASVTKIVTYRRGF